MDIDKLTEFAQKIMQVTDTERRYKAVANLQTKIVEAISGVISTCADLIEENTTLRFGGYQNNIFTMFGQYNTARRCVNLLKDHYKDVAEYENDTEEKRAERKQKLEEYRQTVKIGYTEGIKGVHPDMIYCEHGIYRQYDEICKTFDYRLCRMIKRYLCNTDDLRDLKTLFQKVCL